MRKVNIASSVIAFLALVFIPIQLYLQATKMIDISYALIYLIVAGAIFLSGIGTLICYNRSWLKKKFHINSRLFPNCKYWRQHKPKWSIDRVGEIYVRREANASYNISILVSIKYSNPDPRYPLTFTSTPNLHMFHSGKGREGKEYKLKTPDQGSLRIEIKSFRIVEHKFECVLEACPLISGIVKCEIKAMNRACKNLPSGPIEGKIKSSGTKEFHANIDKGALTLLPDSPEPIQKSN